MLTSEEKAEIQAELRHVEHARAATIDALKIVQKHRGWISDETLKDLADFLGLSVEDIDGVATFYNLLHRKPVGRHVIYICSSISCWICGYEDVLAELHRLLGVGFGRTTPDGRFTLLPIACLGHCEKAPAMSIDGDMHVNLETGRLAEILEKYK
jgi:NADH-quinone oxidoreductase subunit E